MCHACIDIRNKRITREEGVKLTLWYDGKYPTYGVQQFMDHTGLIKEEIDSVFDKYTNKELFETDSDGNLVRDIAGNLTKKEYPS